MGDLPGPVHDLLAHLSEHVADYPSVTEVDASHTGIHVQCENGHSLVVELVPEDMCPFSETAISHVREHVESGTSTAVGTNSTAVGTYNRSGCVLFDDTNWYHLDVCQQPPDETARSLLDVAVHYAANGRVPDQHEHDRITGLLRSFFDVVWPRLAVLASDAAEQDERFANTLDDWTAKHGYENFDQNDGERYTLAAKQYAFLLAARTLAAVTQGEEILEDGRNPFVEGSTCSSGERSTYSFVGQLFDRVPRDEAVVEAASDLEQALQWCSLPAVEGDLLGELYETHIPELDRKAHGQFYTPKPIAETVVRWAVQEDESANRTLPRVLDPATGSGTFAVEAYRALDQAFPDADHQQLLDHVVTVDVNLIPLVATAANLTSQDADARAESVQTHHTSFLDLDPEHLSVDGSDSKLFDAVVGNPPFVRQEQLDKAHYRRHLEALEATAGSEPVSTKSDAYVYFVTQATRFLEPGGRLGFVVPTKWMMTDYGRSFQEFLFEHYQVVSVVGFSAQAFDDALVDASVLLLERCPDSDQRAETVTRFVRLDEPMGVDDVLTAISGGDHRPADGEVIVETLVSHRTVSIQQSAVAASGSGKLAHYLSAPKTAIKLLSHPDLIRLGDLATVTYGNKTGANDFFFLNETTLDAWPIDDRFLTPAIRSVRGVESRMLTAVSTTEYLLDVRSYVKRVKQTDEDGPLIDHVLCSLDRDGYDTLRSYVEYGEQEGYHDRSTCAARDVWFDLGGLVRPEIIHPKFVDDRVVPLWNRDRLAPSNAVDGLSLHDGVDELVVLGLLHSTVHAVVLECWGRAEGGGALQLMTYEMASLPVVDPATIRGERRVELVDAVERLLDGDETARNVIDEVVLDVLGLDSSPDELRAVRETLSRRRRSGDETAPKPERVDGVGTESIVFDGRLYPTR